MASDVRQAVRWISRIVGLLVLLFIVILQFFSLNAPHGLAIIFFLIILLTNAIAWKNPPIGGAIFIILGALGLVIAMGKQVGGIVFLAPVALSIAGVLFIIQHLYWEKKDREEDIEL